MDSDGSHKRPFQRLSHRKAFFVVQAASALQRCQRPLTGHSVRVHRSVRLFSRLGGTQTMIRLTSRPLTVLTLIALMLTASGLLTPALAQDAPVDCGVNVEAASAWLLAFQSADGGFSNGFTPGE